MHAYLLESFFTLILYLELITLTKLLLWLLPIDAIALSIADLLASFIFCGRPGAAIVYLCSSFTFPLKSCSISHYTSHGLFFLDGNLLSVIWPFFAPTLPGFIFIFD